MMADTVVLPENGLSNFCDEFKKQTGIGLSVEKPDHAKYYEKVTLAFASEEPADLIEMGSTYYPELANSGALWDMTDAWNNSTSNCKKIIDEQYVDALKINGQLYGFPMSAGNGTVTYVRGVMVLFLLLLLVFLILKHHTTFILENFIRMQIQISIKMKQLVSMLMVSLSLK